MGGVVGLVGDDDGGDDDGGDDDDDDHQSVYLWMAWAAAALCSCIVVLC